MGMADRIKEKRIKCGLTQEELGIKLGLQKSAIAKYENGRVENIKRSIISQMAKILDTTPAYLMGWDTDTESPYYSNELGKRIREIRGSLTRAQFAKVCNICETDITDIETHEDSLIGGPLNISEYNRNILMKVAKAYSCDYDELLNLLETDNTHNLWKIPTKKYNSLLAEMLNDSDNAEMMLKFMQLNSDNKEIIKSLIRTLEKQESK